ncbi:MAG TPA: peptidoglycan-binding protein [Trebonia sp.]|jgi:zinc D-Ala-D-Ala carboxypeptidase|nr:peptidoglycan-binding protein [Trebonia sp.]
MRNTPGESTSTASTASAALTWPLVQSGNTGEQVYAVQYLLNQQIGAGLVIDGIFGPKTKAAVEAFQKKETLPIDGIVGPQTWPKLIVTVQSGSKGQAVSAVQHNLRYSYGFTTLAVDGIFGPKTEAAVKSFQTKYKVTSDGIVGINTWNALIVHEK